jgi:hypothetical protein
MELLPVFMDALFEVVEEVVEFGWVRDGVKRGAGFADGGEGAGAGGDFAVEEVVGELIGAAEGAGEFDGGEGDGGIGVEGERAGAAGEIEEGDGFELVDAGAEQGAVVALEAEVEVLAFTEAGGVEDAEQMGLEVEDGGAGGGVEVEGEQASAGETDEAEGGEQGGGFAEDLMGSGAAAAFGFVVHAGEVVDDEGGAVDEFDSGGGAESKWGFDAEGTGNAEGEDGAQTLSVAEDGVVHGLSEGAAGCARGRDKGCEFGLDGYAVIRLGEATGGWRRDCDGQAH